VALTVGLVVAEVCQPDEAVFVLQQIEILARVHCLHVGPRKVTLAVTAREMHEVAPDNTLVLKMIVNVSTKDLEGVSYEGRDPVFDVPTKTRLGMSAGHRSVVESYRLTAIAALRQLEPEYAPPEPTRQSEIPMILVYVAVGIVGLWLYKAIF
jgi:hypothetical protein